MQMLGLYDNDFEGAIITKFQEVKVNIILKMIEMQYLQRNQWYEKTPNKKNLKQKFTITEIKIFMERLNS